MRQRSETAGVRSYQNASEQVFFFFWGGLSFVDNNNKHILIVLRFSVFATSLWDLNPHFKGNKSAENALNKIIHCFQVILHFTRAFI